MTMSVAVGCRMPLASTIGAEMTAAAGCSALTASWKKPVAGVSLSAFGPLLTDLSVRRKTYPVAIGRPEPQGLRLQPATLLVGWRPPAYVRQVEYRNANRRCPQISIVAAGNPAVQSVPAR